MQITRRNIVIGLLAWAAMLGFVMFLGLTELTEPPTGSQKAQRQPSEVVVRVCIVGQDC